MEEPELEIGPIDYLVLEYPGAKPTGEALPYLLDIVDRGLIRILDVALFLKGQDGSVERIDEIEIASGDAPGLADFQGASSGLIDDTDVAEAAQILEPGSLGVVLVYENAWAAPFATALRRAGAQMVASGRIPAQDILDALAESEEE